MTPRRPRSLDDALTDIHLVAAPVDADARIVRRHTPSFESDLMSSRSLAGEQGNGFCDVVSADQVGSESADLRNTATLEMVLADVRCGVVRVTAIAPRFEGT